MSDSTYADDSAAAAPVQRPALRMSRRALAIIVAVAVLGVLGVGWMADSFGGATSAPGQNALTRQVGLATVTVTPPTAAQRASAALLLRVTDVTGRAVVGARAQCALSMPAMAMTLPTTQAEATATP